MCVKTKLRVNNCNAQYAQQHSNVLQSGNGQSPRIGIMEKGIDNESFQSGQEDHHDYMLYKQPQNVCTLSDDEKIDATGYTGFTPERRKTNSFTQYRGLLPENNSMEKACDSPTAGNGSGLEAS